MPTQWNLTFLQAALSLSATTRKKPLLIPLLSPICPIMACMLPSTPMRLPRKWQDFCRASSIYYRPGSSQNAILSQRFANIVAEELKKIYPNPQRVNARPTDTLAEVLQTNSPAVLIEVAYHDNLQDAQWIQQNIQPIAESIVRALTTYFGIPFAMPQPVRTGIVETGGANLNIRSMPTTNSTIVALAPNGAELSIYSESESSDGKWYAVRYKTQPDMSMHLMSAFWNRKEVFS